MSKRKRMWGTESVEKPLARVSKETRRWLDKMRGVKRPKKRSNSVWTVSGGLPDTNRRRH